MHPLVAPCVVVQPLSQLPAYRDVFRGSVSDRIKAIEERLKAIKSPNGDDINNITAIEERLTTLEAIVDGFNKPKAIGNQFGTISDRVSALTQNISAL